MLNLCDIGRVEGRNTIGDKYVYENKVYPIEDAIKIQRATFAQTQILSHINLDGESSTVGDEQRPFVTYHEDVIAGTKKRLYRDEIKSAGWYSEITGYGATTCGFVGGSTYREVQIDKFIGTKRVRQEEELCIHKLIGSWKQTLLRSGVFRAEEEYVLSDEVAYAMMLENLKGVDRHAWAGNYKSSDKRYAHTDGFIKIAVKALETLKPAIVNYTFANLQNGNTIEGRVGGAVFSVGFDTDTATTATAFATTLAQLLTQDQNRLFPVIQDDSAGSITVQTRDGEMIDLQFVLTNGDGFESCLDGSIKANSTLSGSGAVTTTVVQNAAGGSAPVTIDKVAITASNVIERIKTLYNAISDTKAVLLDLDFGAYLFVPQNVWTALDMALIDETKNYLGTQRPLPLQDNVTRRLLGFNIVKMNYMPRNEMFFARSSDLHVATNLVSDVAEIRQGYDSKHGVGWFKNAFDIGFQISDAANVAGTFSSRAANEFTDLMPMDNQY